jgi:hypothetical protein
MSGLTDELAWLEQWYQEQCDGDWEHHCGVTIETLDNPGWLVQGDVRARTRLLPTEPWRSSGTHPATRTATKGVPLG